MIDATIDPMAFLEEAMKPQPRTGGDFQPWPWKGPDKFQKALFRPLLNIMENNTILIVDVLKHEYYDNTAKKYVYRNLCTKNLDMPCAICAEVESMPESTPEEKKAKRQAAAGRRFLLPIYLHVLATDVEGKPSERITYKDKDGNEHPVCGPRILEMKPDSSEIFSALMTAFNFPGGGHDITKFDFKAVGFPGSNGFLERVANPMASTAEFVVPADVPENYLSTAGVRDLYWELCPPKIIGQTTDTASATPAVSSAGTVKTAPDF